MSCPTFHQNQVNKPNAYHPAPYPSSSDYADINTAYNKSDTMANFQDKLHQDNIYSNDDSYNTDNTGTGSKVIAETKRITNAIQNFLFPSRSQQAQSQQSQRSQQSQQYPDQQYPQSPEDQRKTRRQMRRQMRGMRRDIRSDARHMRQDMRQDIRGMRQDMRDYGQNEDIGEDVKIMNDTSGCPVGAMIPHDQIMGQQPMMGKHQIVPQVQHQVQPHPMEDSDSNSNSSSGSESGSQTDSEEEEIANSLSTSNPSYPHVYPLYRNTRFNPNQTGSNLLEGFGYSSNQSWFVTLLWIVLIIAIIYGLYYMYTEKGGYDMFNSPRVH